MGQKRKRLLLFLSSVLLAGGAGAVSAPVAEMDGHDYAQVLFFRPERAVCTFYRDGAEFYPVIIPSLNAGPEVLRIDTSVSRGDVSIVCSIDGTPIGEATFSYGPSKLIEDHAPCELTPHMSEEETRACVEAPTASTITVDRYPPTVRLHRIAK